MKEQKKISLKCPICKSMHSYPLTIEYDPVLGLLTSEPEYSSHVRRRLIFTCPTKNTKFFAMVGIDVPGKLRRVLVGSGHDP